uniref:Uncharacterized protein n=1 Tax=Picea sitchensis TaxID=3332 RepID=A9NWT6_PICSI|nr:unknown [Picea sitchensis]
MVEQPWELRMHSAQLLLQIRNIHGTHVLLKIMYRLLSTFYLRYFRQILGRRTLSGRCHLYLRSQTPV